MDDPSPLIAPDTSLITSRAARGSVLLGARQVAITLVGLGGGIVLAHLLTPGEYGVYAVIVLLSAFGTSVGDMGLGASLVRQSSEPTDRELAQVFSAQLVVAIALAAAIWLSAPLVARAYSSTYVTVGLLRWAGVVVIVIASRAIPISMLDRHLAFGRIAFVETVGVVIFNGVAIAGAAAGLHAKSLPVALVCQMSVGAVLAWFLRPTRVGLTLHFDGMAERFRFGLLFQASGFASLAKDAISPLFIGLLLGAAAVGLTEWAEMYATYSLVALGVMQRVYLPMFSRLRHQPDAFRRALDGSIRLGNAVVAPVAVLSVVLADPGVRLVFGERWVPALHLMYLLAFANVLTPTVAPLMGVLNAQGRSGATLMLSVVWMTLTWVIGAPLVAAFGLVGYGFANVAVVLTNLVIIVWVRRTVPFSLSGIPMIWVRAGAVGAMALAARILWRPSSVVELAVYAVAGLVVYVLVVGATDTETIRLVGRVRRGRTA